MISIYLSDALQWTVFHKTSSYFFNMSRHFSFALFPFSIGYFTHSWYLLGSSICRKGWVREISQALSHQSPNEDLLWRILNLCRAPSLGEGASTWGLSAMRAIFPWQGWHNSIIMEWLKYWQRINADDESRWERHSSPEAKVWVLAGCPTGALLKRNHRWAL